MSPQVIALGELLVEVMRKDVDQPLSQPGEFVGPYPSGAPAIFIDAVARLGISAGFVGVVGGDDFAQCVRDRLQRDGVDTTHVRVAPGYTTGIAFVSYSSDGSRHIVFHLPQAAAALLEPADVNTNYVREAQFVHITGSALAISETARQACYKAIRTIKGAGGRVSFDPNIRLELLGIEQVREICQPVLDCCDLVLPSGSEATMLTGEENWEAACRSLIARGISIVAMKRGADGSTVFTAGRRIDMPSIPVTEVDPTGAGDCFGGAFVVGLLEGWDLPKVARFANVAGALAVTARGPMEGIPRRQDVQARL